MMRLEKVFIFFLIVAALIVAVLIVRKQVWPAISVENPLLGEQFQKARGGLAALEKLVDEAVGRSTTTAEYASDFQGFLLEKTFTLEQRVGQLFIIGFEGKAINSETENLIRSLHPGGVLLLGRNIESPEQLRELVANLQRIALEDTGLPLFVAVDQEGGLVSRVGFAKEKTSQSKIKNAEQAEEVGFARAQELKGLGINLNLAPVLDEVGPSDFLFDRTFRGEVEDVGDLARAMVAGQKQAGILTTIKHFPGYGSIFSNPEEQLASVWNVPEISQFQTAMEGAPDFVMTSNVIYQDIDLEAPFTFSPKSIQFLKEKLGDEALVMSDDLSQYSLLNKFSLEQIVGLPIEADVDVLIFSGWRSPVEEAVLMLQELVKNGKIPEEKINQSVLKIIELKEQL